MRQLEDIFKNIERLLRWIYPGLLFFILFYITNPDTFKEVTSSLGFPSDTVWGLILGIIGIGIAIYLIEQYVINAIWVFLVKVLGWLPNHKETSCCMVRYFDNEANKITRICILEKNKSYFYYNWGVYHALAITFWLTLSFFIVNFSDIVYVPIWLIFIIGSFGGKLYLFLKLTKIREYEIDNIHKSKSHEA